MVSRSTIILITLLLAFVAVIEIQMNFLACSIMEKKIIRDESDTMYLPST